MVCSGGESFSGNSMAGMGALCAGWLVAGVVLSFLLCKSNNEGSSSEGRFACEGVEEAV